MASSSSAHPWKYDVYLSFRGSDTHTGFTNYLCKELREQNFETFADGPELNKGDRIASLLQAIRESRIAVVICSENYGESSWCLDELVQIFQCQKSNEQIVMPVFYKVNPTDIRHRKGTFGAVFEENEARREKITEWIGALDQLADSSGFVFPDGNKYESQVILEIVEEVSRYYRNKNKTVAAGYKQDFNPTYIDDEWTHDVYMCSFRDEKLHSPSGFADELFNDLQDAGIKTFRDYDNLFGKGDLLESITKTMEATKNFVIILTEEFSTSWWALDELELILETRKQHQRVIPVFYKVNPEDIRQQTGPFGEEFEMWKYGDMKNWIPGWRDALTTISNMTGWSCKGWLEGEVISNIVRDIMPSHRVKQIRVDDPLSGFRTACPPAGENRVILYTTMSWGRAQAEWESNEVRKILERFSLKFTERNISKKHYVIELTQLMESDEWDEGDEETLVPRLFVKGKYIGGVEEVFDLLRRGKLEQIFEGLPRKGDRSTICKLCREVIPDCRVCDGSREMTKLDEGEIIPYRCIYCAGTGLERCYTCW